MKFIYSTIAFSFLIFSTVFGQISKGGIIPSLKYKSSYDESKMVILEKLDLSNLDKEDFENSKNGTPLKFAQSIKVNLNPDNSGYWENMPNGQRVWRLKIKAIDAKAIGVYYDKFIIPEGGELYLYNETRKQLLGAYTSFNNRSHKTFANELIKGETVTFEYVESQTSPYKPVINISEIAYAFRDVNFLYEKEFGDSQSCQNNINCSPIGDNWQDEKRGVVRIEIKAGVNYYWCTGSLINNTKQDCLPYILTADHCAEGATDSDLQSWVFYFNYEATDCSTPTAEPSSKTMTGAFHIANGGNGGDTGSDFYLCMLETYPLENINVYYNGWNRNTTPTAGGVGIHHPSGDIKKISEYTVTPTSSSWGSATGSHWKMKWSNGVTEEGSSGSPLFDSNGYIIGDLTGGSSMCTNLSAYDYYGKISYSWVSNGTSSDKQLKPWLDPDNTGVLTLDGMNQSCGSIIPVSNFTENRIVVFAGETIDYTDKSTGLPNSWRWEFEGVLPSVKYDQNPTVTYKTPGIYDVSLWARNYYGGDTLTKTDRIIVLDPNVLNANFSVTKTEIEKGTSINFTNTSSASPISFEWNFEGASPSTSTDENPTGIKYNTVGTFSVQLIVTDASNNKDTLFLDNYITVTEPSSVDKIKSEQNLIIYPNPAKDILHFDLKNNTKNIEQIYIYNILGEMIDNISIQNSVCKSIDLNLSEYNSGTYFIKAIVSGENQVSKIIINK